MYRVAVFYACAAAAAALATGSGSIVYSFRTPCTNGVYGIDYHGGYLYHAEGGNLHVFYRTTITGSLVATIPNSTAATGIDRTDIEFWTCNYGSVVYRLTTTGSIIRSFGGPGRGYGITFGEGFLWYAYSPWVYQLTINGSVVASFRTPGVTVAGLCYDAPYLWLTDAAASASTVYQVTTSGSVVMSIPRSGQRPYGVSWDGRYVWYTDYANNWVYCMTVAMTSVAPASFGRIKATYH